MSQLSERQARAARCIWEKETTFRIYRKASNPFASNEATQRFPLPQIKLQCFIFISSPRCSAFFGLTCLLTGPRAACRHPKQTNSRNAILTFSFGMLQPEPRRFYNPKYCGGEFCVSLHFPVRREGRMSCPAPILAPQIRPNAITLPQRDRLASFT